MSVCLWFKHHQPNRNTNKTEKKNPLINKRNDCWRGYFPLSVQTGKYTTQHGRFDLTSQSPVDKLEQTDVCEWFVLKNLTEFKFRYQILTFNVQTRSHNESSNTGQTHLCKFASWTKMKLFNQTGWLKSLQTGPPQNNSLEYGLTGSGTGLPLVH